MPPSDDRRPTISEEGTTQGITEQTDYDRGFQEGWKCALAWAGLNSTAGPIPSLESIEQVKD